MSFLMGLLGAFGRLWFGSDLTSKVWGNRGLQTAFMLLLFFIAFTKDFTSWISIVIGLALACWMQFQEISRGHGIAIDTGDSTTVTEEDVKRYNKRWYHKICDKLLPNHKYCFLYDNLWLWLRYTAPLTVVAVTYRTPEYFALGCTVPFIYTFCNELQEREPWLFDESKWYWRRGWSLAEMLIGFVIVGGSYYLTNM